MREIKFKAFDYAKKEMFEVKALGYFADGISTNDKPSLIDENKTERCFNSVFDSITYKDGRFELLQYTGLKDKNGKEIFEGDILKTETDKNMVVGWNTIHASFVLERDGWMFKHYFGEAADPEYVEIVGNIYQNAEMLQAEC